MEKTTSRVRVSLLVVASVLAAYHGESRADEDPTTDTTMSPQDTADQKVTEQTPTRGAGIETSAKVDDSATPVAPQTGAERAPSAPSVEGKPVVPATSPPTPPATSPLTWYGVTLYGVIDVGVAYLSHGAPPSSTYGPGLPYIVQNFSNRSITSIAGNGLGQSKLGLSGVEPLGTPKLKAVFKLETGFQPTSGRLTDGPKSLVDNNGRAAGDKITAGDSSRAGQLFQGAAYAGLASMLGTLTFGRQCSLMADDLMKYDPQLQSQAFSPIGYSGTSGGLGATENKILTNR